MARALTDLPLISAAFADARISYSKVRALTRVASPANEEKLLDIARHATASQMERILRDYRRCTRSGCPTRAQEEQSLSFYYDDHGDLVFKGRLRGTREPSSSKLSSRSWTTRLHRSRAPAARPP